MSWNRRTDTYIPERHRHSPPPRYASPSAYYASNEHHARYYSNFHSRHQTNMGQALSNTHDTLNREHDHEHVDTRHSMDRSRDQTSCYWQDPPPNTTKPKDNGWPDRTLKDQRQNESPRQREEWQAAVHRDGQPFYAPRADRVQEASSAAETSDASDRDANRAFRTKLVHPLPPRPQLGWIPTSPVAVPSSIDGVQPSSDKVTPDTSEQGRPSPIRISSTPESPSVDQQTLMPSEPRNDESQQFTDLDGTPLASKAPDLQEHSDSSLSPLSDASVLSQDQQDQTSPEPASKNLHEGHQATSLALQIECLASKVDPKTTSTLEKESRHISPLIQANKFVRDQEWKDRCDRCKKSDLRCYIEAGRNCKGVQCFECKKYRHVTCRVNGVNVYTPPIAKKQSKPKKSSGSRALHEPNMESQKTPAITPKRKSGRLRNIQKIQDATEVELAGSLPLQSSDEVPGRKRGKPIGTHAPAGNAKRSQETQDDQQESPLPPKKARKTQRIVVEDSDDNIEGHGQHISPEAVANKIASGSMKSFLRPSTQADHNANQAKKNTPELDAMFRGLLKDTRRSISRDLDKKIQQRTSKEALIVYAATMEVLCSDFKALVAEPLDTKSRHVFNQLYRYLTQIVDKCAAALEDRRDSPDDDNHIKWLEISATCGTLFDRCITLINLTVGPVTQDSDQPLCESNSS